MVTVEQSSRPPHGFQRPTRRDDVPETSLAQRLRGELATHTGQVQATCPMTSDGLRLSEGLIKTLSAELDGQVPADLVADLVRAVLDERRPYADDQGVEPTMLEARRRLERFVRARASA